MKRIEVLFFASVLAIALCGCGEKKVDGKGKYTFHTTGASPSTWNPTDWSTSDENSILALTTSSLYDYVMNATKDGYDIACEMARELPVDVTAQYAGVEPYGVPADATEGYAWKFNLIDYAKWEDGTPINASTYEYSLKQFLNPEMQNYRGSVYCEDSLTIANALAYYEGKENAEWKDVGFIKNDDYSYTLILDKKLTPFMIVYASDITLLKEDLYEANKQKAGDLVKSSYGTTMEKYQSYGPYKISAYQPEKSIHFEKNENWYGWTDGNHKNQYMTTGYDIQFISEHSTILTMFLQGKVDETVLDATDLEKYGNSEYRIDAPQSYTYKYTINIDKESLKKRETPGVNHSILSYIDFRHAMSLCMDRQKYIDTIAPSSDVGFGLLNYLYVAVPETSELYRNTEQAKKALCEVYGTKSVEDITGYDKEQAKQLFQAAYDAALKAGDINDGDKVEIDFHVYAESDSIKRTATFLQESINKATEGTSFEGKISIKTSVDENYYENMEKGNVDMAITAWGGASFDPYGVLWCYCDPSAVHEYGFDPMKETVTIEIEGQKITKTYNGWYKAVCQGEYSNSSSDIKNTILANVEKNLLLIYNMIPFRYLNSVALESQRIIEGSDHYVNPLVGFGGLRFMTYSMDDAAWETYCKKNNNQLAY